MDKSLLQWLKNYEDKVFSSPRKEAFGRDPKRFTITLVDERKKAVRIKFEGSKNPALPLYFTMFDARARKKGVARASARGSTPLVH